jgi:hypothetical protein
MTDGREFLARSLRAAVEYAAKVESTERGRCACVLGTLAADAGLSESECDELLAKLYFAGSPQG